MVKISGDARLRYAAIDNNGDDSDFRARVTFDGKINDNMKFNARITTNDTKYDASFSPRSEIALDTANVTFDALGLTNTIGRQDMKLGNGSLMDTQMTGLSTKINGLKLFAGNMKDQNRLYAGEYGFNLGSAAITADYINNDTTGDDTYGANAVIKLTSGVSALGEFYKTDGDTTDSANAAAYGLKFTKLGLTALYRDVDANALLLPYSNMTSGDLTPIADNNGFKGLEVQYDRNLAKNVALNVKYQDFERQDGTKMDARTAATVNVKF